MGIAQEAAKNSGVIFIGDILQRIIGFFITLLVVRYMGSGDFGKYSLVYAFLSFFDVFINLGLDHIIIRELSRDEKKGAEFIGGAITLKILFSFLGLAACWGILQFMHYPLEVKILIYIASLNMLFSCGTLFNNIFQAKLLMKYIIAISVAMKICYAIFTVILIAIKAKLFYFIILNLLINLAQVALVYYQSKKFLPIRVILDFKIWKELLKNSWPIALNIIFVNIYGRIDKVMLFQMKGKDELGFYAAAAKLAEAPIIIAAVAMVSLYPLFYKYSHTSPEVFKRLYTASFKYFMLIIMPIAAMATFYSRQIILVCYGIRFTASGPALAILIWSSAFIYGGLIHSSLLIATNLQYLDIIFTGFGAVASILLNLVLIPRYGFVGAAIAAVVSYGLGLPLSCAIKRTRRFGLAMAKSMLKPFLSAASALYILHFFTGLNSILSLILGIAVYIFLIILFKEITVQDFKDLKGILFAPPI